MPQAAILCTAAVIMSSKIERRMKPPRKHERYPTEENKVCIFLQ